jgi:hypothetical protein
MNSNMTRIPMWVRKPGEELWMRTQGYWRKNDDPDQYEGYETAEQGERAIDVTGREIFVGDRIAVAVTVSRSANMRVGRVIAIEEIMEDDWNSFREGPRGGYIYDKKGSGKFRIRCEWEASGWDRDVKTSSVEAGLPKYVKLND